MLTLLKVTLVFTVLIFMVRKKIGLGISLLTGALFLGILFGLDPISISRAACKASIDKKTLLLLGVVLLITIMGNILKAIENFDALVNSLESLIQDNRVVMAIVPAIIGLLPMPGGALVSAPMAGEVGKRLGLSREKRTFFNYWFRHIWEYIFPLYPGIILVSSLLSVPLGEIIKVQFPLTMAAILGGTFFALKRIENINKPETDYEINKFSSLKTLFFSIWPILLVIFSCFVLKVPLIIALLGTVILLLLLERIGWDKTIRILKESISFRTIFLILGIMVFKEVLIASGASAILPEELKTIGIPHYVILFAIPFIVGLMVGDTAGFVGITFPVLYPFMNTGSVNLNLSMVAFVGGYAGVLLSPTHLCLVLTGEYFGADLSKVYRMLLGPVAFIVIVALLLAYVRLKVY